MGDTKTSKAVPKVLRELRNGQPGQRHYASDLAAAAGVGFGTIYVALARLEREGCVASDWEEPARPDGPQRRYYTYVGGDCE